MVTRLILQIASLIACTILTCGSQHTTSLHFWPVGSKETSYCLKHEAPCKSRCVPLSYLCDRQDDCGDMSDERSCPNKAHVLSDMFAARSRRHITNSLDWLRDQRKPLVGWTKDTKRVVVTLYLSHPDFVNNSTVTYELAVRTLQFELIRIKQRKEDMSVHDLALYSHALLASCLDPSNFFGENLAERIEMGLNSTRSVTPFVALALCNSNGHVPKSAVIKLINILRKPLRQDLIGQRAFTLMALNCLHNKREPNLNAIIAELGMKHPFSSFEDISNSMIELLLNSQQPDGNFGDMYTTAIVLQAIISSEKYSFGLQNITSAFNYILYNKFKNPSDGLKDAYSLLPLLSGKTLLDLGRVNCSLSPLKEPLPEITVREERIWYSIWIGDDKSIERDMSLSFENESTFYDVMVKAARMNKNYNFEYIQLAEGKYVTILMGLRNDPEEEKHWYLYRLKGKQIGKTKYIYPEHVIPQPNEKFVYWYRSEDVGGEVTHGRPLHVSAVANSS